MSDDRITQILRCPNCDGPLDAEMHHASEWAACDWDEPIPAAEAGVYSDQSNGSSAGGDDA